MKETKMDVINKYLDENGKEISPRKEVKTERIRIICMDLLNGLSLGQIYDKYKDEWAVGYHSIKTYCNIARKLIREQIPSTENEIKEELISKYMYLYQRNMENGDLQEARRVLDSMTKLTQSLKFDFTTKGSSINTIEIVEVRDSDETTT